MLGRGWVRWLRARAVPHDVVTRPALDLGSPQTFTTLASKDFDTMVNCAAWTDVDGAEAHEAEAMAVNGEGVGRLAAVCAARGARLVHFSTDYVFAGDAEQPYRIDAPMRPINAYGRSKAEGELRIRESGCAHLIVRTSWLYAPWGSNFVRTMARLGLERDVLRVVDDQRGRPTSVEHLVSATAAAVLAGADGTLHITDGGECTWFEFATAIVAHVSSTCRVEPCTSAEFTRPAPRPAYSVLDLEPVESLLGPMPPWRDALAAVLPQLES
jgi:dTDP-4-dehydrorhamnose reductase